jgi:hypothetical protein
VATPQRERGETSKAATAQRERPETGTKLVAHTKDGQVFKGFSRDFHPGRESFHLVLRQGEVASSQEIRLEELKALFHVKTWGRKDRHRGRVPFFPAGDVNRPPEGVYVKTVLEFYDGEKILGYTSDYDPSRSGFYLIPADPEDNNEKIYVLSSALVNIQLLRE